MLLKKLLLISIIKCVNNQQFYILHRQETQSESIIDIRVFFELQNEIIDEYKGLLHHIQDKIKLEKLVKCQNIILEIILGFYQYVYFLLEKNAFEEHKNLKEIIMTYFDDQAIRKSNINKTNEFNFYIEIENELKSSLPEYLKNKMYPKDIIQNFGPDNANHDIIISCITRIVFKSFKHFKLIHCLFDYFLKKEEIFLCNRLEKSKENKNNNYAKQYSFIDVFRDDKLIATLEDSFKSIQEKHFERIEIYIEIKVNDYIGDLYDQIDENTHALNDDILKKVFSSYFKNISVFIQRYDSLMARYKLFSEELNAKINFRCNVAGTVIYLQQYFIMKNKLRKINQRDIDIFIKFHTNYIKVINKLAQNVYQKHLNTKKEEKQVKKHVNKKIKQIENLADILKLKYIYFLKAKNANTKDKNVGKKKK